MTFFDQDLPRIGPPSRPGPPLSDLVQELREARDRVRHICDLTRSVEPPLEQQLYPGDCDDLDHYLAGALNDLDAALAIPVAFLVAQPK